MKTKPKEMTDRQLFSTREKAIVWLNQNQQSILKKEYDPVKFLVGLKRYEAVEDEIVRRKL